MGKSAQSRPMAWRPLASIIFPVCVITVALSAISPASSVVRRGLAAPPRGVSVRLVTESLSQVVDEGQMDALVACQPRFFDPTE
jgi:hypothetical protein